MKHYPALDGFRGVAVLAVVLLHARFLPCGWMGVQMFFVLSGFLITDILVRQRDLPFKSYILGFYWRRSLRIWPLYFFYCVVGVLAAALFKEEAQMPANWWPVLSYTYNFQYVQPGFPGSPFFGHFWSLCVEEQFYLVWPFLLYFTRPPFFRRLALGLLVAGPLGRLVTGLLLQHVSADQAYIAKAVYGLPWSHMDAFACGAVLALVPPAVREGLARYSRSILLGALGVALMLGLTQCLAQRQYHLRQEWLAMGYGMTLPDFRQYVWGYTAVNVVGAALLLCLLERTFLTEFFEHPILTYLGKISYGVYVWHQGILHLVFYRVWPCEPHAPEAILRFALVLAASVLLASVSYHGFETFFLGMKYRMPGSLRPAGPQTHRPKSGTRPQPSTIEPLRVEER